MSKFNIGDKVKIKEDLNEYEFHDIIPEMLKYAGKEFEIIDIRYNAIFGECYVLNDINYFWYGDALELVNKSEIKILGVDYTTSTLKIEESVSQKVRGFEVVPDKYRKHPDAEIILPQRNDKRSAGYDLRIPCKMVIPPHSHSELEFTDICAYMQDDEVLKVFVRSSVGCKKGLILANGTGIIDASYYPRNIGIKLYNTTNEEVVLEENERVCQCIFEKYLTIDDDDCMNKSRVDGFGSSGTK